MNLPGRPPLNALAGDAAFGASRKQKASFDYTDGGAATDDSGRMWDVSFPKSLRHCVFAVDLLPPEAAASLIVLTDGVVAFPDQTALEAVLERLHGSSVTCNFVQIGAAYHPQCSLGEVPDTELLHFLASSTGGAVFFASDLPPLPPALSQYIEANQPLNPPGAEDDELHTAPPPAVLPLPNQLQRCVLLRHVGMPTRQPGSSMAEHVSDIYLAKHSIQRPTRELSTIVQQSAVFQGYRPPPVMVHRKKWRTYVMAVDLAACVPFGPRLPHCARPSRVIGAVLLGCLVTARARLPHPSGLSRAAFRWASGSSRSWLPTFAGAWRPSHRHGQENRR